MIENTYPGADGSLLQSLPPEGHYFRTQWCEVVDESDNWLTPGGSCKCSLLDWVAKTSTWETTTVYLTVYDGLETPNKRGRNFALPGEHLLVYKDETHNVMRVLGSSGLRRFARVDESAGISDGSSGTIVIRSNGADSIADSETGYYGSQTKRDGIAVKTSVANNAIVIVEWFADHNDGEGGWIIVDHGC